MIKQFKIHKTRTEADGTTGVIYEVWRVTSTGPGAVEKKALTGYMQIPDGVDRTSICFRSCQRLGGSNE